MFLRCGLRCFAWISLAFIRKEVFFPFGLYIILKRSWDTSLAHAHSAQREATLGSCSIVPGARAPNGARVPHGSVLHPNMQFHKFEARTSGVTKVDGIGRACLDRSQALNNLRCAERRTIQNCVGFGNPAAAPTRVGLKPLQRIRKI